MMPKLTITASNRDRLQPGTDISDLFIRSLQWQTLTDFELLIADGGSKNYEALQEYFASHKGPVPMRLVQMQIGEEFERARLNNVGVRNAAAEYIMTTDVDMMFAKDFVSEIVSRSGYNTMVESRTLYWKMPVAKQIYAGELDPYGNIEDCKIGRIKKRTTAGGCQCMHIDQWSRLRGFDDRYIGWGSEDYDLLTRAKKMKMRISWMGESRETIKLFHQSHPRNLKRDLECQEENKKLLRNIKDYKVNENGWGGISE